MIKAMSLLLLFAAPATAQQPTVAAPDEPTLAGAITTTDPCAVIAPDEVTVCGQRSQSDRYRLDPAVLAADRAKSAERPPEQKLAVEEKCPPHGPKICGGGAIPVSAIALVALKTAITAAKGEDWRAPLGLADKHYDEYRAAKAREERRRKERQVGFGILTRRP